DGQDWTVMLEIRGLELALIGVSCTCASACLAVGQEYSLDSQYVQVALTWDGSQWSDVAPPSGINAGGGVSCAAPLICMTIGGGRWNGRTWVQTTPVIPPPPCCPAGWFLAFAGLSCPVSTTCTAVGSRRAGLDSDVRTLAERYS